MRSKIIVALFLIIPLLFATTAVVSFFLVKNSLVQSEESKQVRVAEIVKQNLNIYFENIKNSLENLALSKTFLRGTRGKSLDLRGLVLPERMVKSEFNRLQIRGFLSDPRSYHTKEEYRGGKLVAWQLYKGLSDVNPFNQQSIASTKRELLRNMLRSHQDMHYAFEMEKNGDLIFLEPFEVQKDITSFNYAFRDYLQMVKKTKKTSASEGYISHDAARTQIITVATPIFDEYGDLRSILAASVSAKTLAGRIFTPLKETIGLTGNSYIMLIDRHGHIVANSQSKHIYFPKTSAGSDDNDEGNIRNIDFLKKLDWFDDVLEVGNIWERKTKSWKSDTLPKLVTGVYTNLDSEKVLGTFLPISFGINESSINWAILVETPVSYLSAVTRNVASLFFIVGLLLLCIVVALIAIVRKNIHLLENDVRSAASKGEMKLKEAMHRIAHDVRKPLMGMKTILHLLPKIINNSSRMEKFTADVDRNISQTNIMLNDMLDFSNESPKIECKENNPQSIITSALSDALRNHPDCEVSINYDLEHSVCLFVDGDKIIRVLTNIIDNAIDAMSGCGNVWIKTNLCDNSESINTKNIVIIIGNDGPIIAEDVKKRLFEPYFTRGKKGGTGLGLSICKSIAELHNGNIEIFSEQINGRNETEFILTLPASPNNIEVKKEELIHHSYEMKNFREAEAKRTNYGDTANSETFMRINKEHGGASYLLVVDDEPLFRETIRSMLNTLGQVKDHVKVIEADSAEVGLKIFEGRKFDYVIVDIDLGRGKMNGYKLVQMILIKYPDTYVLIHSNKRKEEMDGKIRHVASNKFMGFLPKPMTSSELLQFLACKTFEITPPSQPSPTKGEGVVVGGSALDEGGVTRKVLLLNDDVTFNLFMKMTLKGDGLHVLTSTNVDDALHALSSDKFDAILSDINLGDNEPNGYDFLKRVRERDTNIPFVFTSGYSKGEEWPKAKGLGATGYLQLPFESKELMEILKWGNT